MAALAGVNEGSPQEPVDPELAQASRPPGHSLNRSPRKRWGRRQNPPKPGWLRQGSRQRKSRKKSPPGMGAAKRQNSGRQSPAKLAWLTQDSAKPALRKPGLAKPCLRNPGRPGI